MWHAVALHTWGTHTVGRGSTAVGIRHPRNKGGHQLGAVAWLHCQWLMLLAGPQQLEKQLLG